ncbi:MAG: FHA domain-containing serine/threonine-protein kinase [Eggerthellaceae bacterium]|nr:FHA domain-containing serine/threonine-protein kinase [Eggerthellaceae bacterium]MDR2721408.1 protein kinase [Coriobacteriaceae bacterium]
MPERIGPYEIRGELGRGAMAVVWRAWDATLGREVAIKEPRKSTGMPDWLADELESRFVVESRAAARLNHPNIITVYSADKLDGRAAIVMELLEGSTLSEIIDRKQLTAEKIYSIWTQLLDALVYAHSMGVVHRDIKPDNVFVTSSGLVKLTDFGVAHLESDVSGDFGKVIAGSPGYMAPEQIAGDPADARSDLFSFSVIAYEMLALNNPFGATEGLAREELFLRTQASETLPGFAGLPEISAVLARGLRKNTKERWQTGEQYRKALNNAMERERYAFMAHRRGKPFAFVEENSKNGSSELASFKLPKTENQKPMLIVLLLLMGLAMLVGIMAGSEIIIIVSFIALVAFGIFWGASYSKDKVDSGEVKLPDLSNINLAEALDFSAPEALLFSSTKQIAVKLTSAQGESSVEELALPLTIGRDQILGSFALHDERVSGRHLSLEFDGTGVFVSDLRSTNGTFLDGKLLAGSERLSEGSEIRIGNTIIEILSL